MNSKLYVGNLSYQMAENQLEELFTPCGTVKSAKIITDRDSGRSKGFGFVEMSDITEAEEAIKSLDGSEFDGRSIRVSAAQEKPSR